MKWQVFVIGFFVGSCWASTVLATEFIGEMSARDGDSLIFNGRDLALFGIDAMEWNQICRDGNSDWACGDASASALREKIAGKRICCHQRGIDVYDRPEVVCFVGEEDLNAWLVRHGWALALPVGRFNYAGEQAAAIEEGRGVWRGDLVPPWEWREGKRLNRN